MPELQAFYRQHQNKDLVLLTVDIMQGETVDGIKEFMAEGNYTMPVLLDFEGSVSRAYRVTGVPTTFFIDRSGTVRNYYLGPLTLEMLASFSKNL